jgi:hypothetical protein
MRVAKTEILKCFDKQERSYRLALLCTYWIRDTAPYKPSVSETARGFRMNVRGQWLSFADLADVLEQQSSRDALSSDFVLNQLHALIRAPLGILEDYCKTYDKVDPTRCLWQEMRATPWFQFTRIVRNAISHNFHFHYGSSDKLPITWNGITLSREMEGQPIAYELWHKKGYELFLEMKAFAEALPEVRRA